MPHLRVHVADLGLACCAVEFVAAVARGILVPETPDASAGTPTAKTTLTCAGTEPRASADASSGTESRSGTSTAKTTLTCAGGDFAHGGGVDSPINVLIVSGTVTHALTQAVVSAWESLAQPRAAIAFGACTISGGPYWDSYAVAAGIDAHIPVTRYVPGCPPRPEALLEALAAVASPDQVSPDLAGTCAVTAPGHVVEGSE